MEAKQEELYYKHTHTLANSISEKAGLNWNFPVKSGSRLGFVE